jgi:hypothetical protein
LAVPSCCPTPTRAWSPFSSHATQTQTLSRWMVTFFP